LLARELQITLHLAAQLARNHQHEYLTLEHLLYAMLHTNDEAMEILEDAGLTVESAPEKSEHPSGIDILSACGANLENLRADLLSVLTDELEKLPEERESVPEYTLAFKRVTQRAAYHVQASGKKEISAGNLLVSMFRESDSRAIYLLEHQGVTRLDVMNFVAHGISKVGKPSVYQGMESDTDDEDSPANALESFCTELVARASEGHIDPLIGRQEELDRIVHILARRRKNNPLLVGEPGVGKTAIVEGLALRIHEGDVPALLENSRIYSLELGGLLAGTRFRGDFEERLKGVVSGLAEDEDAILFIDEIHTVVGAGSTSGGHMDASNLLKPALANGELRCIGSTTHKDYRASIEHDRALSRRFQTLTVVEPSIEEAVEILAGLKPNYEEHHGIQYTDDALLAAARLAHRHLRDRHLPDSAVDVMDESGAEARLLPEVDIVDEDRIESTIARMARIPARSVSSSDRKQLGDLEGRLKALIYGQDEAVEKVSKAVKLSRAGLGHPEKPVGSFLFAGPTGVGKTELAKQLAFCMGVEFIRFDMSEYMEKHTVSRLIGAPPGYVGFDQGGQLTDAVVKNPQCVLLLDEIEKAHVDLYNVLLQVMDHATLTDNQGRKADFRNVVLIMTTNAGARELGRGSVGFVDSSNSEKASSALNNVFSPEFRNRLDAVVWFDKLAQAAILRVVDKFVMELEEQLDERDVTFDLTEAARAWLGERGYDERYGARAMGRVLHEHLKEPLADEILFGRLEQGGRVQVDVTESGADLTFRFPGREITGPIAPDPEENPDSEKEPAEVS